MINEKYKALIKNILSQHLSSQYRYFIFGSSLSDSNFSDIDVGISDHEVPAATMHKIKEDFENSSIPYKIDCIDFSNVDQNFKEKVFQDKILWLT